MTEAIQGQAVGAVGTVQAAANIPAANPTNGGLDFSKIDWNNFDPSILPRQVIEKHPDFNGLRSTMDKRLSATERRYQEQLQNTQRQAQAQLEQLQQILGSRMDDGAKRDVQQWQINQRLEQLRQENQALKAYYGRQSMLSELSSRHGIPLDELADVEEPTQAYEKIVGHQASALQKMQKQLEELTAKVNGQVAQAALPTPDLGGGSPTAAQAAIQQKYDEAMRSRNTALADKIQLEAVDHGIDLDLYSFRNKV